MSTGLPVSGGIEYPLALNNVNLLTHEGATQVAGTAPANVTKVKIAIFAPDETIPDSPPEDAVVIDMPGTTGQTYLAERVLGARGSLGTSNLQPNTVVVWHFQGDMELEPDSRQFLARQPSESVVTVPATSCLWFAWAENVATGDGTTWEPDISAYRPFSIGVPPDAQQARISYLGGQWGHHGDDGAHISDANGEDEEQPLQQTQYQATKFNSVMLQGITARLNRLVAMVGPCAAPTSAVTEQDIGNGPTTIPVADKERLLLGFHDGFEWSNNTGGVIVKIEWL